MKKILISTLVLLVIISAISYFIAQQQKQKAKTNENEELVALGDSLTYGVGDKTGTGYVGDLQKLLSENHDGPVTVHNYGIPGQQTDGLLQQLKKSDIQENVAEADYIIIFIGTNDLIKSNGGDLAKLYDERIEQGKADYEKNLKRIFSIIRENNPDAPVLYLGLYNPFPSSSELDKVVGNWNESSQKIVSDYSRTKFIETNGLFDKKSNKYFSDALHPTEKGYKLITQKIIKEYDF
ncbi:GDSL-type esterase/lipase family protein [Halobacillus sp. MO56]